MASKVPAKPRRKKAPAKPAAARSTRTTASKKVNNSISVPTTVLAFVFGMLIIVTLGVMTLN